MTEEATELAADQRLRDMLEAFGEVRQALARMEALLRRIALSLGIRPDG